MAISPDEADTTMVPELCCTQPRTYWPDLSNTNLKQDNIKDQDM